jgi:glycosyltransferase involved in cell wall biosynthesis
MNRLGFACKWEVDPKATWSGTNWALMTALQAQSDTVDVGTHLSPLNRRAWQIRGLRRQDGAWVTRWENTPPWEKYLLRDVQRRVTASGCDAVLEIQDVGVVDRPFFIYQDLSYDVLARELESSDEGVTHFFRGMDRELLERRRARQHEIFAKATGVLAMSASYAESLVRDSGLPADKVHVAYPGATSLAGALAAAPIRNRLSPRTKLLFVGTTFLVKSGDVVLKAFELLRQQDRSLTLTIVGPATWPMDGPVPDGVDFRGRVPRSEIATIMDEHDLFVMPSRLEGFGMVFVEALARGLPCIGRRAFAMPELIEDGVTGAIVDTLDPIVLAESIVKTLADDSIYETTSARAATAAELFSWDRTAATMIDFMKSKL